VICEQQEDWIRARFRHYDAERCAPLWHEEQPPGGIHTRRRGKSGEREFPAVVFKNAVTWYPCRDQRPAHRDGVNVVKTDAPANVRPLLFDTLEPEELVLVEGEGHLIACVSVGLRGVVAAGGVGALISKRSEAAFGNRALLRGKSVRIMFDPDEHGRHAAPKLKKVLEEAGVTRVAIVDLRQAGCAPDDDVEDWLNGFDTPEAAYSAVAELLSAAEWGAVSAMGEGPTEDQPLQEGCFPGPTLAVMVWDGTKAQLAVNGPAAAQTDEETEGEEGPGYPGVTYDADEEVDPDAPRAWRLVDTFRHGGVTYIPDMRGGVQQWLETDSLVLPPPPFEGEDTSAQLWTDLVAFYRRWFAVEPQFYDVMAAYCFLTYRLVDAGFEHIGFLRFVGPPSSGKNRGLDMLRFTCWRTYTTQPTASNLHRVVHYFGHCTLVIDEFHPSRGRSDSQVKDLMDLLNLAFTKSATMVRMIKLPDGSMIPDLFNVFGAKIFASYECDEDEAFARRAVIIPTGEVEPSDGMMTPQFPPEAKEEAKALRARLLGWRGRKLTAGLPDISESGSWKHLLGIAGPETSQVFWPLLEMVPSSHTGARDHIIQVAQGRRDAVSETRYVTDEAYLLDRVASMWEAGGFHKVPAGWFIPTREIADEIPDEKGLTTSRIGRKLRSLGLEHCTRRYEIGNQAFQTKGFEIADPKDVAKIMKRHGVKWPRTNGAETGFEEAAPL
jgi:hypothetical protein